MRNTFAAFELSKEWLVVLFSNKYFTLSSEMMIDLLQQGLKNKRSQKSLSRVLFVRDTNNNRLSWQSCSS